MIQSDSYYIYVVLSSIVPSLSKTIYSIILYFIFSFFIGLSWSILTILSFDEDKINSERERAPLIFCFVISSNERHETSARAIIYSWGKRCDRFYFVTRLQNTSVDLMMLEQFDKITDIKSTTLNQHTLDVLLYLRGENLFSSYNWFLRATDDSYVIIPNLRKLVIQLHRLDKNRPYAYVGDVEQMYKKYQILSTGSVMLFNRNALNRLYFEQTDDDDNEVDVKNQDCLENMIYDHEFIKCMKQISVDMNPIHNKNLILSQNLSTYKMDKRLENLCCSPSTVAFRSSNETDMFKFDFLYHRLDAISKINLYE